MTGRGSHACTIPVRSPLLVTGPQGEVRLRARWPHSVNTVSQKDLRRHAKKVAEPPGGRHGCCSTQRRAGRPTNAPKEHRWRD